MHLKRWFTKRRLLTLAVLGAVYISLWVLTHFLGAPQVRKDVLMIPRSVSSSSEDFCFTRAYAPFIVRADYSFGPGMAGFGGSDLYLWAFGKTFKILTIRYWVS
jgi:hypothetical protein